MSNEHVNKTFRRLVEDALGGLLVIRANQVSAPVPTDQDFATVFVIDQGSEGWDDSRYISDLLDLKEKVSGRRRYGVQIDFYRQYTTHPMDYAEAFRSYLQTSYAISECAKAGVGVIGMPDILDLTDTESAEREQRSTMRLEVYHIAEYERHETGIDVVNVFGSMEDRETYSNIAGEGWLYRKGFRVNTGFGVVQIDQTWPLKITLSAPAYFSDGRDIRIRNSITREFLPIELASYDHSTYEVILYFKGAISDLFRGEILWGNPNVDSVTTGTTWTESGYQGVWHADENYTDSTGLSGDGSITGNILTEDGGKFGKTWRSDSFEGTYVTVPPGQDWRVNGNNTLMVLTKLPATLDTNVMFLSNITEPLGGVGGYAFYIQVSGTGSGLTVFGGGGGPVLDVKAGDIDEYNPEEWYFLAYTRVGDFHKLYRNGELIYTTTNTAILDEPTDQILTICGRGELGTLGKSNLGYQDETFFASRAFTDREVKALSKAYMNNEDFIVFET